MTTLNTHLTILLADDDEEDRMFTREALAESGWPHELHCVQDGEELLDFLDNDKDPAAGNDWPDIILLDLNMPKKDGRETLHFLKNDPQLRSIPVVVLTTSGAKQDILDNYAIGANTYITKPITFENLVLVLKTIGQYWFTIAQLPERRRMP